MPTDEMRIMHLIKFFEDLCDVVCVVSYDGDDAKLLHVSSSLERLWGRPTSFLHDDIGHWLDSVHEFDRVRIKSVYKRRMNIDRLISSNFVEDHLIYRIMLPDKKECWIREEYFPLCDDSSNLVGHIGVLRNMTDYYGESWFAGVKSRSEDLSNNLDYKPSSLFPEHFVRFAECSKDVLWIRSADYQEQLYVSPVFEDIWGVSCQSLYEHPESWETYLYPEDKQRMRRSIKTRIRYFDSNSCFDESYRIIRPDGNMRWIKDTSFPIFNDEKVLIGYAGVAKDVTDVREKNERLRLEKRQADVANTTKSNFLAMVSHELRTPLNGIIGLGQILMSKVNDEQQFDMVKDIYSSAEHLLQLVNDLLDFSKLSAGKMEQSLSIFNVHDMVSDIVSSMTPHIFGKPVQIVSDISSGVPSFLEGDCMRIRQVLVNFLSNAIKFTPEGEIRLFVGLSDDAQSVVTPVINFSVIDNGIGIASEMQESIFDSFFQVEADYHRSYSGTGLGLTICKQLVMLMEGTISVESELDHGSKFSFCLPLRRAEQLPLTDGPLEARVSDDYPIMDDLTVLVVEDNIINQKVISALLAPYGCKVHVSASGDEAIDYLNNSVCDLIFMDIGLPDTDGLLVTQKIRHLKNLNSSVPVIAVTAHAFENDKAKCYDIGMNDFLIKPITVPELKDIMVTWYHRIKQKKEVVQTD